MAMPKLPVFFYNYFFWTFDIQVPFIDMCSKKDFFENPIALHAHHGEKCQKNYKGNFCYAWLKLIFMKFIKLGLHISPYNMYT